MTASQYIGACRAIKKVSQAQLARALGQSPQNLGKKIISNTLRADELFEIAEALGATVKFIDKETGKPII